jgi:glycogen(starch) synthase
VSASRQRLKIALVGPFPPPYGGMASYDLRLKAGILAHDCLCLPVPLRFSRDGRPRRFERIKTFFLASLRVLGTQADIVHCITGSQPNLVANAMPLLAARMRRRPSVLSIVGGELPDVVKTCGRQRRAFLRFLLSLPRLVIACNAQIEGALHELGIPATHRLWLTNALPPEPENEAAAQAMPQTYKDLRGSHDPVILSISAWYDHYGSLDLVRAFAGLRQSYPRLGLALVCKQGGDEAFRAKVGDFLASEGLLEHIASLENVADVLPLMRRSDVFVRTPHQEGDSISVREALEIGAPVVASDVGHRPAGVALYRPGDSEDLREKLEMVLSLAGSPDGSTSDGLSEGEENLKHILQAYAKMT